jgi:hypothetical protein
VWINSAAYQGVPRILLAGVAFVLVAVAVYSFGALRQLNFRNAVAEHRDGYVS